MWGANRLRHPEGPAPPAAEAAAVCGREGQTSWPPIPVPLDFTIITRRNDRFRSPYLDTKNQERVVSRASPRRAAWCRVLALEGITQRHFAQ